MAADLYSREKNNRRLASLVYCIHRKLFRDGHHFLHPTPAFFLRIILLIIFSLVIFITFSQYFRLKLETFCAFYAFP